MAITSSSARISYGIESTFGSEASSINRQFGEGVSLDTHEKRNQVERVLGIGQREAQALLEGPFQGAFSLSIDAIANPWWLELVVGTSSSTGSDPYTHTFATQNDRNSATIAVGYDLDSTDIDLTLKGCVVNSATISASVGSSPSVTIEGLYADESKDTSLTSEVSETFDPYHFGEAELKLDNSVQSKVQSAEVSITNNANPIYSIDSRTADDATWQNAEYTVSTDIMFEDANMLEDFYGTASGVGSSVSELTDGSGFTNNYLEFDKADTADGEDTLKVGLQGLKVDSISIPTISPEETISESLTIPVRKIEAEAVNSTSEAP